VFLGQNEKNAVQGSLFPLWHLQYAWLALMRVVKQMKMKLKMKSEAANINLLVSILSWCHKNRAHTFPEPKVNSPARDFSVCSPTPATTSVGNVRTFVGSLP